MQLLGPYDISFAEHAFFQLVHPQAYCACFSSNDHLKMGRGVDGGERGGWMSYRGFGGAFLCVPYCHLQSSFLLAAVVRALEIYAFRIGLDYFT